MINIIYNLFLQEGDLHVIRKNQSETERDFFQRYIKEIDSIAEFGCGGGFLLKKLKAHREQHKHIFQQVLIFYKFQIQFNLIKSSSPVSRSFKADNSFSDIWFISFYAFPRNMPLRISVLHPE